MGNTEFASLFAGIDKKWEVTQFFYIAQYKNGNPEVECHFSHLQLK